MHTHLNKISGDYREMTMNMNYSRVTMFALAAIASIPESFQSTYLNDDSTTIGRGRIVDRHCPKRQPRNAMCCCGSGIKAKKCCVYYKK